MIGIAYFNIHAKKDYLFRAKLTGFEGLHYQEIIPFSQTYGLTPGGAVLDIHPEYFLILPNMFHEQINSKFDEWVYTLKNSIVKPDFSAAGLQEAVVKLDMLKMSVKERRTYEKYLRNKTDDDTVIETYRMEGREEGILKGREEGILKGREEGKKEGILEGREEGKKEGIIVGREEGEKEGILKGREEGKKEGLLEGREEERKNMLELLEKGYTLDQIKNILTVGNAFIRS